MRRSVMVNTVLIPTRNLHIHDETSNAVRLKHRCVGVQPWPSDVAVGEKVAVQRLGVTCIAACMNNIPDT